MQVEVKSMWLPHSWLFSLVFDWKWHAQTKLAVVRKRDHHDGPSSLKGTMRSRAGRRTFVRALRS